jgi:N-dimethylarginine dimethylaminohydrolase
MISLESFPQLAPTHEPLIAALRAEIEEHGGLVAILEDQQAAILARDPEKVAALAEEIQSQALVIRGYRKQRDALVAQMAPTTREHETPTISDLLPLLREPIRPLIEALKSEINRLVTHTRRRVVQNQMLLQRTMQSSAELPRRMSAETASRPLFSSSSRKRQASLS